MPASCRDRRIGESVERRVAGRFLDLELNRPTSTAWSHLIENLGAEDVTFSDEELADLNSGLAAITIHGDRLQPAVLAQTGVEAPLQ